VGKYFACIVQHIDNVKTILDVLPVRGWSFCLGLESGSIRCASLPMPVLEKASRSQSKLDSQLTLTYAWCANCLETIPEMALPPNLLFAIGAHPGFFKSRSQSFRDFLADFGCFLLVCSELQSWCTVDD
jgi:hypothetical protein